MAHAREGFKLTNAGLASTMEIAYKAEPGLMAKNAEKFGKLNDIMRLTCHFCHLPTYKTKADHWLDQQKIQHQVAAVSA